MLGVPPPGDNQSDAGSSIVPGKRGVPTSQPAAVDDDDCPSISGAFSEDSASQIGVTSGPRGAGTSLPMVDVDDDVPSVTGAFGDATSQPVVAVDDDLPSFSGGWGGSNSGVDDDKSSVASSRRSVGPRGTATRLPMAGVGDDAPDFGTYQGDDDCPSVSGFFAPSEQGDATSNRSQDDLNSEASTVIHFELEAPVAAQTPGRRQVNLRGDNDMSPGAERSPGQAQEVSRENSSNLSSAAGQGPGAAMHAENVARENSSNSSSVVTFGRGPGAAMNQTGGKFAQDNVSESSSEFGVAPQGPGAAMHTPCKTEEQTVSRQLDTALTATFRGTPSPAPHIAAGAEVFPVSPASKVASATPALVANASTAPRQARDVPSFPFGQPPAAISLSASDSSAQEFHEGMTLPSIPWVPQPGGDTEPQLTDRSHEHIASNVALRVPSRGYSPRAEAVIPGGYHVGDAVISQVTQFFPTGESVNYGDMGTVLGPCADSDHPQASGYLLCTFPKCLEVNMLLIHVASSGYERVIPGGYRAGDTIVSQVTMIFPSGDAVMYGDVGRVMGPCSDPSKSNADRRVNCAFPTCAGIDLLTDNLAKPGEELPIPGGYKAGDSILSQVTQVFPNGDKVSYGDKGIVLGPCLDREDPNAPRTVRCAFTTCPRVDMLLHCICHPGALRPIPGGFAVGDAVESKVNVAASKTTGVAKGDIGRVLGPCSNPRDPEIDRLVICSFPKCPGIAMVLEAIQKPGGATQANKENVDTVAFKPPERRIKPGGPMQSQANTATSINSTAKPQWAKQRPQAKAGAVSPMSSITANTKPSPMRPDLEAANGTKMPPPAMEVEAGSASERSFIAL